MPRGMALAWFVFAGQPLLFATYLLALALNYVYCVASTAIYRRVREIPRRRLVWDIACVILGVPLSTFEDFLLQFGSTQPCVLPSADEHAFAGSCICSNSRTVVGNPPRNADAHASRRLQATRRRWHGRRRARCGPVGQLAWRVRRWRAWRRAWA